MGSCKFQKTSIIVSLYDLQILEKAHEAKLLDQWINIQNLQWSAQGNKLPKLTLDRIYKIGPEWFEIRYNESAAPAQFVEKCCWWAR